jgi:hypothetical protein
MGGTIEVESEKGEGTTFIIEMPREVGSQAPDHDPLDREDVTEGDLSAENGHADIREADDSDDIKLGLDDDELTELQRGQGGGSQEENGHPSDAHGAMDEPGDAAPTENPVHQEDSDLHT